MTARKPPDQPLKRKIPAGTTVARSKRGARCTAERKAQDLQEARSRGVNTSTYEAAAQISPNKPLTEKQKLFVKYWASGETILAASHKAGYADGGTLAYRMVRMPNILRLYEAEKKAYEAASNMSRKRVMDGLLEAVEMAKLLAEPSSMIAGWREIGKMCGYYEPVKSKIDVTVNGNVVFERLNRLSDAELLKLIQEGVKEQVADEATRIEAERQAEEEEIDASLSTVRG